MCQTLRVHTSKFCLSPHPPAASGRSELMIRRCVYHCFMASVPCAAGTQPSPVDQGRGFSKEVTFMFLKDEEGLIKWGRTGVRKVGEREHSWTNQASTQT